MAFKWVLVFNGTEALDSGLLSFELHKCHQPNIALKHLTKLKARLY